MSPVDSADEVGSRLLSLVGRAELWDRHAVFPRYSEIEDFEHTVVCINHENRKYSPTYSSCVLGMGGIVRAPKYYASIRYG